MAIIAKRPSVIRGNEEYKTHLLYIQCLSKLMQGATLHAHQKLKSATLPLADSKAQLIKLTKKSLLDEKRIVEIDEDYSYASTSWLPIKIYYLIYNHLLTANYFYLPEENSFKLGHTDCVNSFTAKLANKEISFSSILLNTVYDGTILSHVTTSGSNLSKYTEVEEMYKLALRKIAKYKLKKWIEDERLNIRRKEDKEKYIKYIQNNLKVSIFDFIYHMRLRSNYRDFAFIDGVTSSDTKRYFEQYMNFGDSFVLAIECLLLEISQMRNAK